MTMDEIISFVDGLDGVLTLRPAPGDGSPEIGWGDTFFYYAPDGVTPTATQPFATVVIKNYPGDEASRLERPDTFRVNISAGKEAFIRWTGHAPREPAPTEVDPQHHRHRDRAPRLRHRRLAGSGESGPAYGSGSP
ncbi:hypothetical protein HEK616_78820 (plasmid) [Streptomyces nigrescens]|uniref:DUF6194 domain-containing protein n=1 Tax=Streptomyces nigrescens TaxID=1920 RepID=A0ABM8A700_STRNI|nr:hypothetical protein HEK616_78820 [Streptomyces nigrescens]